MKQGRDDEGSDRVGEGGVDASCNEVRIEFEMLQGGIWRYFLWGERLK